MVGIRAQALWLLALAGCAELSPIEEGVCGNEVLDPGEDCDTYVDSSLGTELACGSCRYTCAEALCPQGWDCGRDSICRQPAPELAAGPVTPNWSPASFDPVDFNGDGVIDLVGAFAEHVEFRVGDATGAFGEGFLAPTLIVSGEVRGSQLDGDPFGDVMLPTEEGLLVWRGQPEGPPLPVGYAAYPPNGADKLLIVPVRYPDVGKLVMVFYEDADLNDDDLGVCLYNDQLGLQSCHVVDPERTFDEIGERLSVGDLENDGNDEVAIGFAGETEVRVFAVRQNLLNGSYSVGGPQGSAAAPMMVNVSQPAVCEGCSTKLAGQSILHGVHFADADGDGNQDLLVSVTGATAESEAVVVVRGDGEGGFHEPYLDARFELLSSAATVADGYPGELQQWPIAAGNIDDDGIADYVSPNGIFLGGPDQLSQVFQRKTLHAWTAATLSDIDGDGATDLAAIADGKPLVDVVRCETALTCKQRPPYITKQAVTKIRAGSLQGLVANDIVVVEQALGDSDEDDAVSVLYAQPFDWPLDPIRQARFHFIEHLEVGDLGSPAESIGDGFDDVVLSTRTGAARLAVGILWSQGTGALSSPYFPETVSSRPVGVVSADFMPGDDLDDVVLFGESGAGTKKAWWLPGTADAAFPPVDVGLTLSAQFGAPDFDLRCVRYDVGDIDGDHRIEMVVLEGQAVCPDTATTKIAVGRVDEWDDFVFQVSEIVIAPGAGSAVIALADLDGDGRDDLVLGRDDVVHLAYSTAEGLGVLAPLLAVPDGQQVIGLSALARSLEARGADRVAVLTESSLLVISNTEQAGPFVSSGATSLRSADVDGDGLGDLLLLGDGGVQAFITNAEAPLGGE